MYVCFAQKVEFSVRPTYSRRAHISYTNQYVCRGGRPETRANVEH